MSIFWWLGRWSYFKFMLRELSSVFVAWFVVYMLLLVSAVQRGDSAYQEFITWSASPLILVVNIVSLLFIIFHTVTWFNLTPQAIVVRMFGKRVPGILIAGSNYVAWALTSALVAWLLLDR